MFRFLQSCYNCTAQVPEVLLITVQVLASPWSVMRALGMEFGFYLPVMPIGGTGVQNPSLNCRLMQLI